MNSAYGLSKNFSKFKTIALWAGMLCVFQAIAWMGLTITGIVSYNCQIDVNSGLNYGSLIETVFLVLYFRSDQCKHYGFNSTALYQVETILDPTQILIWDCVYLGVAVCWLISSTLLLTSIKKDNIKLSVSVVYLWVVITLCISSMDLALGVIFGIDYGRFKYYADSLNLQSGNGPVDYNNALVVGAMVSAMSMMILSLKGFVLWLINVGFAIGLFVEALKLGSSKDGNDRLFMPRKNSDIMTTRPPITAYEELKIAPSVATTGYTNDGYVPTFGEATVEVNPNTIARAARVSTDTSLQDHRFRNLDAFEQYPPPRSSKPADQYHNNATRTTEMANGKSNISSYPEADYSPPMQRANQSNQAQTGGDIYRNHRY